MEKRFYLISIIRCSKCQDSGHIDHQEVCPDCTGDGGKRAMTDLRTALRELGYYPAGMFPVEGGGGPHEELFACKP